jgi:hypothetical protein
MKLEIKYIKDRGTTDERIVLVANEDCDIGKFFVFTTKKNADKIVYTNLKQPYWFPDKVVKKGDLVILYTKSGVSTFKENEGGNTSHFYYRGIATPALTDNNYALIVEANTWKIE